ncbi:MAG: hypothetical protein AB7O62_09515 [Pirellulales bacterium]
MDQPPLPGSNQLNRLSQGLRCKQVALVVLLVMPLSALLAWRAGWQPVWLLPMAVLAVAIAIDLGGRVLCSISGIGDPWLIGASVAVLAIGVVAGLAFIVSVPTIGWPIGLAIAAIFQVAAAMTFTNYLAGVGRILGDDETTRRAARLRNGIFGVLASTVSLGGVSLVVMALLAIITVISAGYGLFLALPVGGIVLLAAAGPLIYFVVAMYRHYAVVLSRTRAAIANPPANPFSTPSIPEQLS